MRSSKRRKPLQPLNFTPDEPKAVRGPEERARSPFGPTPKPVPTKPDIREGEAALVLPAQRRVTSVDIGWARHAYVYATVAAVAWAALLFTYTIGYVGGFAGLQRAPMQLAVVCLMAVLPALFIYSAAFLARQGARLASEARWARTLSDDLVTPMALAAVETGELTAAVRAEVERASAAVISAHGQLISVRETLAGETERLTDAAAQAQHTARAVGETLARERDAVAAVIAALREQSADLKAGVERQSRMVAEASDLARTQLQEAEATLASGAERLASASTDAGAAARHAGEGLAHQAERLDVAAAALSERLRFLDARLNDQRTALGALVQSLETEQDDIAARLESHRAQLLEVVAEARASAAELGAVSGQGAEALRGLISAAGEQTRDVAAAARAEQETLRREAAEARLDAQNELHRTLDAMARAGEDARRAIAEAGQHAQLTATARIAAARTEVEQLGELAFAAGQGADQAFQSRLSEARRMIDQTAALIEEAGRRAGERIENGLGASRGALGDLVNTLADIDEKLARLPQAAREQAEAVRAGVERSLSDLTAAARRASDETQGLDAAFQDRIRRNYETLSEAVRLMGRVAGAVDFSRDLAAPSPKSGAPAAAPPQPEPAGSAPTPVAAPAPTVAPSDPFAGLRRSVELVEPASAEPPPAPSDRRAPSFAARAPTSPPAPVFGRAPVREEASPEPADLLLEPRAKAPPVEEGGGEPALRQRLKFTPTEADQALKAVFSPSPRPEPEDAAGIRTPGAKGWDADLDEWTWKDLLTSMDEPTTDADALAEQMIREIEGLGVDAAALLPRSRLEDVADLLVAGDAPAARDAVRRLAPAAIRRLSRRVLTDRLLREQVDRYVVRYQGRLADGAQHENARQHALQLLGDDAGRAYLLLEAAVGDL